MPDLAKPSQAWNLQWDADWVTAVAWLGSSESRGVTGRVFEIEGGKLSVADGWMSTHHAIIRHTGDSWIVGDTHSRNGTRVNGSPVTQAVLKDGDLLELGHTVFLFRAAVKLDPKDAPDLDGAHLKAPAPGLATFSPALAPQQ